MSVIGSAQERPDSPKINATLNKVTMTREFLVATSSLDDGPIIACNAPGIPLLYTPYVFGNERHQYALVREIDAHRIQPASNYWVVTVKYETPGEDKGNESRGTKQEKAGENDNPLLKYPDISTSMEKFQEVVWYTYNPISQELQVCQNSAGQVFDPPPMRDASRLILTITRNEALTVLHPSVDIVYMDACNADVWWGCAPGTWKIQGISTQRETKQLSNGSVFGYLRCTYKFEARPTWDLQILDAGSYYLTFAGGGKKTAFLTDDGHPRTGALQIDGSALPDGSPPNFKTYRVYKRSPFGPLQLPQSFANTA